MSRSIRVGDKVQAFLDANILGEVVDITSTGNNEWTIGGTQSSRRLVCRVLIKDTDKIINVIKSELFIVEY